MDAHGRRIDANGFFPNPRTVQAHVVLSHCTSNALLSIPLPGTYLAGCLSVLPRLSSIPVREPLLSLTSVHLTMQLTACYSRIKRGLQSVCEMVQPSVDLIARYHSRFPTSFKTLRSHRCFCRTAGARYGCDNLQGSSTWVAWSTMCCLR